MKKIVLLLIGLLFLSVSVSAYQINIDAPDSLAVGKPLVVTGTTTLGVGTPIDVVLYHQLTTTSEVKRIPVYVRSDKTFRVVFDTTVLKPGTYKVEVPSPSSGDSISMRLVTLFDRTEDIRISSPLNLSYTGRISVAGEIKGAENSGVQIEVLDPYGLVVFGPQYISTDNAARFSAEIPLAEPGTYEISFTDAKGYIGSRSITSVSQSSGVQPESPATAEMTRTVVISAHAQSSRDTPAYFIVKTGTGPVTLYTSKSPDWVIEYIDDNGVLHMENDQGEQTPERALFQGKGKTVYVKVYPYRYSVTGDVFLYGENVNSVVVSPTTPASFAAAETPTTSAQESPVMPAVGVVALGVALLMTGKKR